MLVKKAKIIFNDDQKVQQWFAIYITMNGDNYVLNLLQYFVRVVTIIYFTENKRYLKDIPCSVIYLMAINLR